MSERAEASGTEFWADADEGEALARYRTLVNAIDDGIYQLDAEGRFVAVNDVVVETTGYPRDELLGEHVSVLLDADDVAAVEREIDRRLAGADGRRDTFEFDVRTADGGQIPCELRLNLLVEDGAFRGTLGVVRDVSDRRRTERALRERDRQLERERDLTDEVLDASPVGVVVRDAGGDVSRTNERARELLGLGGDGSAGSGPAAGLGLDGDGCLFVSEDGDPVPPDEWPFARALATGEPVYDRVLGFERPGGERRWLSVSAAPIATGGAVDRIVTTYEDVTAMKRRERELADELDEMVGRFTDAFYALDADWRFTYANDRAEELIDYRGEGLVGEEFWEVFEWADGSRLGEEYRTAMATQEPTTFEFYYPEPLAAWYEVHAYPSETGLSVYFRDVTERRDRERRLEESERRYRTLVEHFPNGAVALVDEDLRYRTVGGDPIGDYVGSDDLEGRPVGEVLAPELADEFESSYAAALRGEPSAFDIEFEGRSYQVRIVPVRDDDGVVFAALGMSQDVTEQKERERELERYRSHFRTLNEHFPNGAVALVDEDLRYVSFGGTPEVEGVDRDELVGRRLREGLPEELADVVVPHYEAALDGEAASFEERVGGGIYQFHFLPVRDDDGEVFAALGMSQDVTERKERERDLRDAKSQLEAAAEAGAVGTWEWHIPDDEFVCGTSFARVFGVDPEAAREGVSIDRFVASIHEDDRDRVERSIEEAVETCGDYEEEYRVRNADGELRWVVARGYVECDESGEPTTFPGALADITERKRAERELEDHRKQLETLFEVLPVGVLVADADGGLIEANEAARRIWGVGSFEADAVADYARYRARWADTGERVAPAEWTLARVLDGEEVTEPDVFEIEAEDGERRVVMAHGMPVRDADGAVARGVATLTDITDRRESQRRLEEHNERLESFASMLAHELRNPVTIGQIYSEQLPADADSEAVGYVTEAFDRIEDMIDVMLVLTRGREAVGESGPLSLADAARDAWEDVTAAEATLTVDVDRVLEADETYVRHLFRNLFENAVQHGGPDVAVRVGALTEGSGDAADGASPGGSGSDGEVVGFYVADDGAGIPPEGREQVFEAGFTTAADTGGTGLGLAFVEELAEVYGWSVDVTESESGGARFEFSDVAFGTDG
ncbi:PAS domain S-box protein [Halorussus sp. AFM4]|uniref:PAS domain S-box protein n=1 Tax=Halorussus sp. AFM4 TaxID=3421651 RepID=UPI003EBE5B33